MNTYELRVAGVETDARLAAARWELFVCPEVRDVARMDEFERVAIRYEGAQPDVGRWIELLSRAGYPASTFEQAETPPAAAWAMSPPRG